MTVIRLDAATLAKIAAAGPGPVCITDQDGRPVGVYNVRPVEDADEPLIVRAESAEPEGPQ